MSAAIAENPASFVSAATASRSSTAIATARKKIGRNTRKTANR
jgi:hypothetical protein